VTSIPTGSTDRVFAALADPNRRRLLAAVSSCPATATELAGEFPISRQAVVKHLSALADAGLLERERRGREVRYRMTPEPLSSAVSWMAEVGGQWDQRLAALATTFPSSGAGGAGSPGSGPGGAGAYRGEMPR
jgi:DNA-binding transcriptional ArsR family regulator